MAQFYSFFDQTVDDPRVYTAEDFAKYWRSFLSNGIYNGGTNLEVYCTGTDRITRVKPGKAFINGYYYDNSDELELQLEEADGTLDRIDLIVLRLDKHPDHRYIKAFIVKGIPSSNPIQPTLTRDDTIHELLLATVRITHNTTIIQPSAITDERFSEDCGLVNSLITVDTASMKQTFDDFMDTIKNEGYAFKSDVGDNANLQTTVKDNLVSAINEVFQSGVERKNQVVDALNSKKTIPPSTTDESWDVLIPKIGDIKEGSGNATQAQVLSGKTFTNNDGVEYTGTMPNRGNFTVTPSTTNKTIPNGYHNGSGYVVGDPDLVSGNIKSGKNIFGVQGNTNVVDTSGSTIGDWNVIQGYKGYGNGQLVTGSVPNQGSQTATLINQNQKYTISRGYHDGTGSVTANITNLIPNNIRSGVNVGGVIGTLIEGKRFATGISDLGPTLPFDRSQDGSVLNRGSFTGNCGFKPNFIICIAIYSTFPPNVYTNTICTHYCNYLSTGWKINLGYGLYDFIKENSNSAYVNDNGSFRLPLGTEFIKEGIRFQWYAYQ